MSSKLEPVIWLRVLVTLAYMKGWTDVRTDVYDVMAIKLNFLTSMGYQYFLNYGAPRARAFAARGAPLLLDKLNYYGFRGIVNQWFSSYLTNGTQTTEINSYIPDKEVVSCGVPQASVLGPLLPLLCVHDIQHCSRNLKFFLFCG